MLGFGGPGRSVFAVCAIWVLALALYPFPSGFDVIGIVFFTVAVLWVFPVFESVHDAFSLVVLEFQPVGDFFGGSFTAQAASVGAYLADVDAGADDGFHLPSTWNSIWHRVLLHQAES